jgi:hypothetical protein
LRRSRPARHGGRRFFDVFDPFEGAGGVLRNLHCDEIGGAPAVCALAFMTWLGAASAQVAGQGRLDAQADAQDAMNDALFATPNAMTPAPLSNLYATAPGLEAQTPSPQFRADALLPLGWSSNADELSQGGTSSGQWRPIGNLSWASPLGDLPVRATFVGFAETDRYFQASNVDLDKTGGSGRLQLVDPGNDQALSPYIVIGPRWDFTPTFDSQISARQDFNLGFNKRFNFDANFQQVAAAADTSGETVWSLGLTAFLQRRLREPQVSSYAAFVIPSLSYASGRSWNASLGIEFLSRWFGQTSFGRTSNYEIQPVATLEYVVPAAALGGERNAALFGHPAFDLQGSYQKVWSNGPGGGFEQWQTVAALKMGWRF